MLYTLLCDIRYYVIYVPMPIYVTTLYTLLCYICYYVTYVTMLHMLLRYIRYCVIYLIMLHMLLCFIRYSVIYVTMLGNINLILRFAYRSWVVILTTRWTHCIPIIEGQTILFPQTHLITNIHPVKGL